MADVVVNLGRRSPLALLALGPLAVVLDWLGAAGPLVVFVLAAAALIPLAWAIGEATEKAAYYTGPGVGGFLNATFGNAPELIIALVAVSDGLTEVVRASLVGSVVGNLLLVLGFTLIFGQRGPIDRASAAISLGLVALTLLLLLITSVPGFHGDPDRRSLAELALPVAAFLLVVRVTVTRYALRRQRGLHQDDDPAEPASWSFRTALAVLALATLVTAFVTNSLVGSLEMFADRAHLSEFFVAIVIVAIVGNAAEHGSAVLLARRGKLLLATEISFASSAQVAGLLIPLVALVSWAIDPLTLSFRPVELAALAVATVLPGLVLAHGRTTRLGGWILLLAYAGLVVVFSYAGNR
ncbi:MAG: Ca2+:H+ antiporter [Gaiellales bacterium]|nr:Ca2+:H+ antiporter [Gaiellales bacterium]